MSSSPMIEKSPSKTSELRQKQDSPDLKEPDLGVEHEEHGHGVEWAELVRIAFVALAAAAVWFRLWEPFPHVSVIGVAATLIGGYPIFKEAFAAAALPYFNPHSFRKTLALLGGELCETPEQYKAWSQNLGHEHVLTTFMSYGQVSSHRQAEIIRTIRAEPRGQNRDVKCTEVV